MNNLTKVTVGVDVSKDRLDVYMTNINCSMKLRNTATGFKELIKKISSYEVKCIAFESTGGFERKMQRALQKAGYITWLLDPAQVKAFIRSEGIKAKNDAIDAKKIAEFASQKQPKYLANHFSDEHLELRALVKRKENLTNMAAMEKKRFNLPCQTKICQTLIRKNIEFLEQQKTVVEEEIKRLISRNQNWMEKVSVMQSIPGIGQATASVLVSHMPELGSIDHKQAAALLGAAPYTQESGQYTGKASIYAGRSTPRWTLYMATLTGVRCNPILKEFYKRLRDAGKPPKVSLVAAMRKLLCIINAMLRDLTYWKAAY